MLLRSLSVGRYRTAQIVALSLVLLAPAHGHIVAQLFSELSVPDDEDRWELVVYFDAGFALPEMRADSEAAPPRIQWLRDLPPDEHSRIRSGAETYLRDVLTTRWNGAVVPWDVFFPDFNTDPPDFPPSRLDIATVRAVVSGRIDQGDGELTLGISESGPLTLVVETSPEVLLSVPPGQTKVLWTRRHGTGEDHAQQPHGQGLFATGFRHVLPAGLDHVLFILGLFLFRRDLGSLLAQSLAFTVAHSLTLCLVLSGVSLGPSWIVEVLIAASIAYVAIENLLPRKTDKALGHARLIVVTLFGFLHGMGFASVLADSLRNTGWQGILTANLGIEAAQITILTLAWLATIGWHQTRSYAVTQVVVSAAIAATGVFWVVQRIYQTFLS